MLRSTIKKGIFFGLFMGFATLVVNYVFDGPSPVTAMIKDFLFAALFTGVFFAAFLYFWESRKQKGSS